MAEDKKDNVIKFPRKLERTGTKYRQQEITRLKHLLQLCDEDMQTLVLQIDQLNIELGVLTKDYENILNDLKKLLKVEGGITDE